MRKNPERVAWIVLILSFIALCLILVGVPLGIRWFIWNAESDRKALVESLAGTVVVDPPVGSGSFTLRV